MYPSSYENLAPSARSEYLIVWYRQVIAKGVQRTVPMSEPVPETHNEEQKGARYSTQTSHCKKEEVTSQESQETY